MKRQRGITFWSFLLFAAVFVSIALLFLKLFPAYMEFGAVKTIIENVAKDPDIGTYDKGRVKIEVDRRFIIEDVKHVDLNKDLYVEKKPGAMTIRIAYEVRIPVVYNITALLAFDASKTVTVR